MDPDYLIRKPQPAAACFSWACPEHEAFNFCHLLVYFRAINQTSKPDQVISLGFLLNVERRCN